MNILVSVKKNKRAMMALYCSPEYHITQGEYDLAEEHFCKIILKSSHRPRRRCCYFKGFSIFSSGGHSVQRRRTILAILVKGY